MNLIYRFSFHWKWEFWSLGQTKLIWRILSIAYHTLSFIKHWILLIKGFWKLIGWLIWEVKFVGIFLFLRCFPSGFAMHMRVFRLFSVNDKDVNSIHLWILRHQVFFWVWVIWNRSFYFHLLLFISRYQSFVQVFRPIIEKHSFLMGFMNLKAFHYYFLQLVIRPCCC